MIRWVLFLFAVAAVIHPMARALRSQTDRSTQFQADEAVEVFCDSKWWQGKVVATVDTGLTVAYVKGGKETIEVHDLAERVRRYETAGISVHSRVQANFEDGGVYFEGAISSVNGNGTYDIKYDDGDEEKQVRRDFIRVLVPDIQYDDDGSADTGVTSPKGRKRAMDSDTNQQPDCAAKKISLSKANEAHGVYSQCNDDGNLSALINRWKGLRGFDMWWPCTLDEGFWDNGTVSVDRRGWHVYGLHHAMQVPLEDFTELVHANGLWPRAGKSWTSVFSSLQFPRCIPIRQWGKVGNSRLNWINFYDGDSEFTDPKHQYETGYTGPNILDVSLIASRYPFTWERGPGVPGYSYDNDEGAVGNWPCDEDEGSTPSDTEPTAMPDLAPESMEIQTSDPESHYSDDSWVSDTAIDMGIQTGSRNIQTEPGPTTVATINMEKEMQIEPCPPTPPEICVNVGTQTDEYGVSETKVRVDMETQTDDYGLREMAENIKNEDRKTTKEEQKALVTLVKMHETEVREGVHVAELEGGRGRGRVAMLRLPNKDPTSLKSDSDLRSAKQPARRGNNLTYVADQFNMGSRSVGRFVRDRKWGSIVASALSSARLVCESSTCNVSETESVMCAAGANYNAMRKIRQELSKKGRFVASEAEVKRPGNERNDRVRSCIYRKDLQGSNGTAASLVYVVNQVDLLVYQYEALLKAGDYVDHFNDNRVYISFTQDKGQGVGKFGFAIASSRTPCAWWRVATFQATLPLRDDQKSKPNDSAANFTQTLPLVPWYAEIQHMTFVVVGTYACLIPKQAKRTDGSFMTNELPTEEKVTDFRASAAQYTSGSPASIAALRSAPVGSATIIIYNGCYIGVTAGTDVYVAFSVAIPLQDNIAPYYQETVSTMTPDLLAGSELGGMPGQSSVNSIKGAGSGLADPRTRPSTPDPGYGYDFKKAAAGIGPPLRPRTDELQLKYYKTFLELKKQGVKVPHFMGVSEPSALPCSIENVMSPALHFGLGGGNWVDGRIKKELTLIEKSNPRKVAEVSLLQQRVGVAEAALGISVGEIAGAIGYVVVNETCFNDVLKAAVTRANAICTMHASFMQGVQSSGACEEQVMAAMQPMVMEYTWLSNSVQAAEKQKAELSALKDQLASAEQKNPPGELTAYWEEVMSTIAKISREVYWKNTMNGPAVWLFFTHHRQLLDLMAKKITDLGYGTNVADAFRQRHMAVIGPLGKACSLARAARRLKDTEIDELVAACDQLGKAWRASYPDAAVLSPKMLSLVTDVPRLVKIWKSIGLFGEDGMEALHPKWRDAMLMVRSMRNPEAKLKAGLDKLHMQMRVLGRKREPDKKTRK